MKHRHAVQFQIVVSDNDKATGLLIEQLRYAGIVSVMRESDELEARTYILKITSPRGLNDKVWTQCNVERMQSFGINAVQVNE